MSKSIVYIYGKHAVEEARAHAPHVVKKVMTDVKGEGHGGYVGTIDVDALMVPYEKFEPESGMLVLAGLTDPHNVGAIIRSAAAFNIGAVLMPKDGQAQVTSAVAKTSAGMIFRIPLVSIDSATDAIKDLKSQGYTVYGLAGGGSAQLGQVKFGTKTAFVVGNEGAGLSDEVEQACDALLSIPINARTESLNAAAAAAVVMYDWSSQMSAQK